MSSSALSSWQGAAYVDASDVARPSERPRRVEPRFEPAGCDVIYVPFEGPRMSFQVTLRSGPRVYRLRGAFAIKLEYLGDGTVFASHENLPVHGYGRSVDDALQSFSEMFDLQWRELVEIDEPEVRLTSGARRDRERLQSIVQNVEELEPR